MDTQLESIIEVLKTNHLTENYALDLYGCWYYPEGSIERKILPEKISDLLKSKVLTDIKLAEKYIQNRLASKEPQEGDYLLSGEKYYMLVSPMFCKDSFQYTSGHYLHLSNYSSYAGGFCFDINGSGKALRKDLVSTGLTKEGKFWFFSNNEVKGDNGVSFSGEFKVWALK